jgi:hypothetical protein
MMCLTFIAISQSVAVDVEWVVSEEEEAEPRLERVDRDDQQDPDDVALLGWILVVYQVLINLQLKNRIVWRWFLFLFQHRLIEKSINLKSDSFLPFKKY